MIGIICAEVEELEAVKKHMKDIKTEGKFNNTFYLGTIGKEKCVVTLSRVGKVNAARSTQLLIDYYIPDYIINCGVAGGLGENIKIGDIVIGEKLVQYDMDITAYGREKGELPDGLGKYIYSNKILVDRAKKVLDGIEKVDGVIGTIASGDKFVTNVEESEQIHKEFEADCCEMEGGSIAQVCFIDAIPFIVIRSISDCPNDNNKVDFDTFLKNSSEIVANFIESFLK